MTVSELIEELERYPPDTPVVVHCGEEDLEYLEVRKDFEHIYLAPTGREGEWGQWDDFPNDPMPEGARRVLDLWFLPEWDW